MEIPPASSFSQASALFNDSTQTATEQAFLGIFPFESPNTLLFSSNVDRAASHTGLDVEFRTKDLHEGHRLLNAPLLYPFQDKAQIFNHKFDPFYFDGTELDDNYNVQENLIGTPLGASTLEDPRMTYVKNILQMKEMHGANYPLDDSYIKELYMVNAEKGSNYYQTQLDKLDSAMSQYTRVGRYTNHKPLQPIQFTQNIATGNPIHEKHTARKEYAAPSEAGNVQHSRRRKRMERIDAATAPYNITPINPAQRKQQRGTRTDASNTDDSSSLQSEYASRNSQPSIFLPDDIDGYDSEEKADSEDESIYNRDTRVSSLGGVNVNVTPHSAQDRRRHAARESITDTTPSTEEKIRELMDTAFYPDSEQKLDLGISDRILGSSKKILKQLMDPTPRKERMQQPSTPLGNSLSRYRDTPYQEQMVAVQIRKDGFSPEELVLNRMKDADRQNTENSKDPKFISGTPSTVTGRTLYSDTLSTGISTHEIFTGPKTPWSRKAAAAPAPQTNESIYTPRNIQFTPNSPSSPNDDVVRDPIPGYHHNTPEELTPGSSKAYRVMMAADSMLTTGENNELRFRMGYDKKKVKHVSYRNFSSLLTRASSPDQRSLSRVMSKKEKG